MSTQCLSDSILNSSGENTAAVVVDWLETTSGTSEIDTRTVPQYNDVNLNQWRAKDQSVKRERERSQLDETQDIKCEPDSDRISIDELAQLSPQNGKVTINTGAGKDVLSINAMIGKVYSNKRDYLVADLGADGNMLSMGAALGIGAKRGSFVAGVVFDNTGGAGKSGFRKEDFRSYRCVGHVKHVTIFKGSRLHDTVVIGARGPFTVIQNTGANDYIFHMPDILAGKTPGQPTRFEIMDISGNRPFIKFTSRARTRLHTKLTRMTSSS
ncbi:hypothetical protein OS493_008662 [Desmophyllum pertusum]|uniref:Uncharacterized protein n=1 Tax=Desmophyllum pertusum TaxID=174260 RepID=A0A9W9ZRL3_9CNID|nr:hypothetical protein OS493_008662 [Desmophyllum pertusum]